MRRGWLASELPRLLGNNSNIRHAVQQFDQAGFVIGTSSSLFNILLDRAQGIIDWFDTGIGKPSFFS